jgi:hypothetical protein
VVTHFALKEGEIRRKERRVFGVLKALYCSMQEAEIQAAARQLIWLHGTRAQLQAAEQADKTFSRGDIAGFHKWNRIKDAIKDIERKNQIPAPL